MAVQLIDPLEQATSLQLPTAAPKMEQLFIFAELVAYRRQRSIFRDNGQGQITLSSEFRDEDVNFLGFDNNDEKFTTRWTRNYDGTGTLEEGFGMTDISISIPASFIPQVTIEFVDIRGLAFFNRGEESPYNVLLDMPPPLFSLKVKGYYGRALKYDLHLTKTSVKYSSTNGNYNITANFVARTFTPLTDIPFKYAEIAKFISIPTEPQLDPTQSGDPDVTSNVDDSGKYNDSIRNEPNSIRELLSKLESLNQNLNDVVDGSELSREIDSVINKVNGINDVVRTINNFSNLLKTENRSGAQIFTLGEINNNGNRAYQSLASIGTNGYNNFLRGRATNSVSTNLADYEVKLYIGVPVKNIEQSRSNDYDTRVNDIENDLRRLKSRLYELGSEVIDINLGTENAALAENISNGTPVYIQDPTAIPITEINREYIAIDISRFYDELYRNLVSDTVRYEQLDKRVRDLINNSTKNELGFTPTIYNIFKVLCDDVDYFFKLLKSVVIAAERHHEEYKNIIINDIVEYNGLPSEDVKISAFPLYTVIEGDAEVRRIPSSLAGQKNIPELPEVQFVRDFAEAFLDQRKAELIEDLREQLDDEGNFKWIPFSPIDSTIAFASYESPYVNATRNYTLDTTLDRILQRYYAITQYTNGVRFTSTNFNSNENKLIISLFAESEAVNLAASLINSDIIDNLLSFSRNINGSNLNSFYSYLQSNIPSYNVATIPIINEGFTVVNDKTSDAFLGIGISSTLPQTRIQISTNSTNSDNLVDRYINNIINPDNTKFERLFRAFQRFIGNDSTTYKYSRENLTVVDIVEQPATGSRRTASDDGNVLGIFSAKSLRASYITVLNDAYTNIEEIFTSSAYTDEAKKFFLLSLFQNSYSYLTENTNDRLNEILRNPVVLVTPLFSLAYNGALVKYNDDNIFREDVNDLLAAYTYVDDSNAVNIRNESILTQASFVATGLSNADQITLLDFYETFINSGRSDDLLDDFLNLLNDTNSNNNTRDFQLLLENEYSSIFDVLSELYSLAVYNDIAFSRNPPASLSGYTSLNEIVNENSLDKFTADNYFRFFFEKLKSELETRKEQIRGLESEFRDTINENDIYTELYYSFKSISDKWISGLGEQGGYPWNLGTGNLIDLFAFIDRANNAIGERCIINTDPLLDAAKNYDNSMFTVMSNLLANNEFEFFPLQNFMVHNRDTWENAFKPFETAEQIATPVFVCMYIGGTSSFLAQGNKKYLDDGLTNFGDASDFQREVDQGDDLTTTEINELPIEIRNKRVLEEGRRYKYSDVRAFKVRVGEQNQSFFTDIQIDSREYPETNESLQILSKLAGDESAGIPVSKGQNLFSTYENRSYSATISMLGNMMIQPSQYFYIENLPLYYGAYLIIGVEHQFTANHALTNFKGVRIIKFPKPIVTEYSTKFGYKTSLNNPFIGNATLSAIQEAVENNTQLPTDIQSLVSVDAINLKIR